MTTSTNRRSVIKLPLNVQPLIDIDNVPRCNMDCPSWSPDKNDEPGCKATYERPAANGVCVPAVVHALTSVAWKWTKSD